MVSSSVLEYYATVAQSVEQLIRNQQVRCSSHPTSSKPLKTDTFSRFTPSERGLFFHVIISTNKNAGGNTEQEAEKKIFCVIYST